MSEGCGIRMEFLRTKDEKKRSVGGGLESRSALEVSK